MNRLAFLPTLALAAGLLAGCAGPQTRYYSLAEPAAAPAQVAPPAGPPLFIELAPLALPERLARPQMVVRQSGAGAQVEVLEQHRWASSFESELRDALAAGIAARLGAVDVTQGGRAGGGPAWRIAVQVRQFDAVEGSRVDAALSWTIRRSGDASSTACQWSASEPAGAGIDALAQGAQRLTGRAAEAIARHLAAVAAA
ncbi:MAG: PqiC family protein, partial [Xenophilus sp.]